MFVIAHKEHGRYMLHSHIQLFLEELSMALRNIIFAKDDETKKKARADFLDHIDKVMDSSYGVELATDCPKEFGSPVKVQNEPDIDTQIAKARHKSSCCDLNAQLIQYPKCLKTCSHNNFVHNLLQQWKQGCALPEIDEIEMFDADEKDVSWPTRAKLDMAAYTHSYHMMHGCARDSLSNNLLWKINA